MWITRKDREIQDLQREVITLRGEVLRARDGRDALNRELGGLRTQNVQLQRDNAQLAHQMELVIVQLAAANDERVALLRSRGVPVADAVQFGVSTPQGMPKPSTPLWEGRPLEDDDEKQKTLDDLDRAAAASLFDDPGDTVAGALGRRHNETGEVEYVGGR